MAEVSRAQMARELKSKYKQMSEVQLAKMIQMFEAECKMQKTATQYLQEQVTVQEAILQQLSVQREKDKIQAAESKLRIQGVRKRYEFAVRKSFLNAQQVKKGSDDEEEELDSDGEKIEDDSFSVAPKGEARLFYEGQLMPVSQIKKWCASQITHIIDEQNERLAQTQEQIIKIFKDTDKKMLLFGKPLEE